VDPVTGIAAANSVAPMIGGASPIQWLQAASPILGKALGGSAAGPSRADSSATQNVSSGQNNSGWTVATGSASATGVPASSALSLPIILAALAALWIWKH